MSEGVAVFVILSVFVCGVIVGAGLVLYVITRSAKTHNGPYRGDGR
jgi:energy-converting hydrogenase Eha subunit G